MPLHNLGSLLRSNRVGSPPAIFPTHPAGVRFSPQVYVCNFDLPQHNIPAGAQPPPTLPTLYRLLSVSEARLAAPIMNMLVDTAHIGGWIGATCVAP